MKRQGKLLGLMGRKRAGKDSVADVLVEECDWQRVGFADPMRRMASILNPWVEVEQGEFSAYNDLVKIHGYDETKKFPEVRQFLQKLGTECGRDILGKDIWVDTAMTSVIRLLNSGIDVVVTDVRFDNEILAIKERGGQVWRIDRPDLGPDDDLHPSEMEWRGAKPDVVIANDGSLADLRTAVLRRVERVATTV